MYVCTSSRAHGQKSACAEIKERKDEMSTRARKKIGFIFFTSSVATLSDLEAAEDFILLKQNKIVGTLSEI